MYAVVTDEDAYIIMTPSDNTVPNTFACVSYVRNCCASMLVVAGSQKMALKMLLFVSNGFLFCWFVTCMYVYSGLVVAGSQVALHYF